MYQIAMSVVHDLADDEKYDSDSFVHGIPDLGVGLKATIQYCRAIEQQLGVAFTTSTSTDWVMDLDSPLYYKAEASMQSPGRGPATIYVELQTSPTRDNPEEIVHMMQVMAKFTNPDLYYSV
jgi:hypothetical protein